MNPAWIAAGCTVVGLLMNAGWSLYNFGQRAAIKDQKAANAMEISNLKQWIGEEYVAKELCELRHAKGRA